MVVLEREDEKYRRLIREAAGDIITDCVEDMTDLQRRLLIQKKFGLSAIAEVNRKIRVVVETLELDEEQAIVFLLMVRLR